MSRRQGRRDLFVILSAVLPEHLISGRRSNKLCCTREKKRLSARIATGVDEVFPTK